MKNCFEQRRKKNLGMFNDSLGGKYNIQLQFVLKRKGIEKDIERVLDRLAGGERLPLKLLHLYSPLTISLFCFLFDLLHCVEKVLGHCQGRLNVYCLILIISSCLRDVLGAMFSFTIFFLDKLATMVMSMPIFFCRRSELQDCMAYVQLEHDG